MKTVLRLSSEVLLSQMQASESQERLEELKIALSKEKHLRAETEEVLMNRQNVFDIYANRYETKIRYNIQQKFVVNICTYISLYL